MSSCEPDAISQDSLFLDGSDEALAEMLEKEELEINPAYGGEFRIYDLNDFKREFMTDEKGDFGDDDTPYRTRATNGQDGIYLFSIDTIPTDTIGIYIRGRVCTDDFAGNFYKSLVIQQAKSWWMDPNDTDPAKDLKQQCLRVTVDLGSIGGFCQIGQEILIRCNGLSIGRYANQPQLCVPTYNNNVYASSATQKVGWMPGRIPAGKFRNAVKLLGTPDPSKLIYDECLIADFFSNRSINYKMTNTINDMWKIRLMDGRLVRFKNVCFTGDYFEQDGSSKPCVYNHPDSATTANVFAPTTGNLGYPQSRIIRDKAAKQNDPNTIFICCANSEYCKFSNYLLPGALEDSVKAVSGCSSYSGVISGILGWYCDNASSTNAGGLLNLCGKEWSVSPRGIQGIGIEDIANFYKTTRKGKVVDTTYWVPKEFDPQFYYQYKYGQEEEEE